jgi:lycopene cyclase domain-containing protein
VQTYLWIDILTFLIPFAFSFHKKIKLYKDSAYIIPAILAPAFIFITWDHYFTELGVWSFNPALVTGKILFGLPLEEVLFFVSVPYCCIFIYAASMVYIPKDLFRSFERYLTIGLILIFSAVIYLCRQKLFTSVCSLLLLFALLMRLWAGRRKSLSRFYLAFTISLVPFFIIYVILTSLPLISYDPQYITGIHIFTIPIEDLFYFLALILWNTGIYSFLKSRFTKNTNPLQTEIEPAASGTQ